MAYKQFTKCTSKENFSALSSPLVVVGGIAGLLGLIASIFLSALSAIAGPAAFAIWYASAIAGYATIISVFDYLLGGKLICLGGDKSASGKIASIEPPSEKDFPENLDNDYSFNLLLHPHPDGAMINENNLLFQDQFVIEQEPSKFHNLPFKGYAGFEGQPILHCEIEGSRIKDTYTAFLAAWTALLAAVLIAVALSTIPIIGWLLALIAALLGLGIGAGIVAGTWALADDGKISDIDPTIGELHKGDHLYVYGTWTYDSGHNSEGDGWNEFHPVKHLQRVDGELTPEDIDFLEGETKEKLDPEIKKERETPENGWIFHPEVDICEADEDEDEPDVPK